MYCITETIQLIVRSYLGMRRIVRSYSAMRKKTYCVQLIFRKRKVCRFIEKHQTCEIGLEYQWGSITIMPTKRYAATFKVEISLMITNSR